MATVVEHEPDALTVVLVHAGQRYAGSITRSAAFVTTAQPVGSPSELHTLTIAGQFSLQGFTATVDAAVSQNGVHSCDYVVDWVGSKTGSPNVIPE